MRVRKMLAALLVLCLMVPFFLARVALADASDYAGEWTCVAVDAGDGEKRTEYEGVAVGELMRAEIRDDGTLTVRSMDALLYGTWAEAENGVSAEIDGDAVFFELVDGQLVNDSDGVLIYLAKDQPRKSGGLLGILKVGKYTGEWVATGIDAGDGTIQTQLEGLELSDLFRFTIKRDGTFTMTSGGFATEGTWAEAEGGIAITAMGDTMSAAVQDGKLLVAVSDGVILYMERPESAAPGTDGPQPTAAPEPEPVDTFAGTWSALRYETGGYWYDAKLLFPQGCVLTLEEDGTGRVQVTNDYAEKLTWSEEGGELSVGGSYVFAAPKWDGEKGELSLRYGTSDIRVFFVKGDVPEGALPGQFGPIDAPPDVPEPSVRPENTQAPEPAGDVGAFSSPLFSASFPEGWTPSEYSVYVSESYCYAKYEKLGADGYALSSIYISASDEGVYGYRDRIRDMTETAAASGGELAEATIGGIAFQSAEYDRWGARYLEYAARVPESRITLSIIVESPDVAGEDIEKALSSVVFTLPELSPPNVDPPMPEDGTPYVPKTGVHSAGGYALNAEWLEVPESIVLESVFGNQLAIADGKLYALTGDTLYAFSVKEGRLVRDEVFENGAIRLDGTYEYLSAGKDGILYVSQGFLNTLSYKGGKLLKYNTVTGDVVMHPDGNWGISFWANSDTKKVTASKGALIEEPWVLTGLADTEQRKGRFSLISCVYISDSRVYVAGFDAQNGETQRIAVYDFEGNERMDFGGVDWTQEDAFSSVVGIVETGNGILVLDGNNRAFKLFSKDGAFIGSVDADELLGTRYPWYCSMIPAEDGVYVAAAQRRTDDSCDELLLFKVSGF
jgi:outer membrane protein assembly factor BamB